MRRARTILAGLLAAGLGLPVAAAPVTGPKAAAKPAAGPTGLVRLNGGAAQAALPGRPQKMDAELLGALGPSFISLALLRVLTEHPDAAQDLVPQMAQAVRDGEGWVTPSVAGEPFFAVADFPAPAQIGMLELPLRCPVKIPDPQPGQPAIACRPFTAHGLSGLEVTAAENGRVISLNRVVAAGGRFYELLWQSGPPSAAGQVEMRRFMESLAVR